MPILRKIPLKYRLPLLHSTLWVLAHLKSRSWKAPLGPKGPLVVTGFLKEHSGIAQGGRLTLESMRAAGFAPVAHDIATCYKHYLKGNGEFPVKEDGGVWLIHANAQECLIAMLAFPPDMWKGRYRIGYWAWETTQADPIWTWTAQFLHEIWVPSHFVRDALDKAFRKANKPQLIDKVRVMPHPIAHGPKMVPDRKRFGLSDDALECLCLFDVRSAAIRKNPWASLEAWLKAFPQPVDKVNLHLKIQHLQEDDEAKQRLDRMMAGRTDIFLTTERFSDEDMARFIRSFDVLISLHRSEGFGLTLAEAMYQGVTPVATGWSGNVDFMNEDNSYLVPYRLIPVGDPSGMYGGWLGREDPEQEWSEPDTDAAAAILRHLVTDPMRAEKLKRAETDILQVNQPWLKDALERLPFHERLALPPSGTPLSGEGSRP